MTVGGASATGVAVGAGGCVGSGCEGRADAVGVVRDATGGALACGASVGDGAIVCTVASTEPVATSAAGVGAGVTALTTARGLDETKNPATNAAMRPTSA